MRAARLRRPSAPVVLAAAAAFAWACFPGGAAAGPRAAPGVASDRIVLGATAPLGSPADAAVVRGAQAYLAHVSARGGVHGRRLVLRILDDGGDPARAAEATRQLLDEGVFALFGSAGTEQCLALRPTLAAARVPLLFAAAPAVALGRHPWTLGFGPSNAAEGWLLGSYLARTAPRARVGVLVDGSADAGELLAGLRRGIAGSAVSVRAVEVADPGESDLQARIARLRAAAPEALALLAGAPAAQRAREALRRLAWRPVVVLGPAASAVPVDGAVATSFTRDAADPRWAGDAGVALLRSVLARHAPGASARDPGYARGMAAAYELVRALRAAGPDPTRAGVLTRARSLRDPSNPFLLPGIVVRTGPGDAFPVEQAQLRRWSSGRWRLFGGLWSVGRRP